jgi:phage gp36-like protein
MTYSTQQNLIDRFGERELIQLTDRADVPTGQIVDAVLAAALADADRIINGYVMARYALPLVTVPELLGTLAADIARYKLYKDQPGETVRKNYEDALRQLRDISNGLIILDVGGIEPASSEVQEVRTSGSARVFSSDTMRGY